MASIVTRGKSCAVVYTTTVDGIRKQKWETYHTRSEAECRIEQLALCRRQKELRAAERIETMEQLMEVYLVLYGALRWSLSTYRSNCGLIRHYILPHWGSLRLDELSPRVAAELYRRLLTQPRVSGPFHHTHDALISPCTLRGIHKLLHSAFEQAVLWEYIDHNPFHRTPLPPYRPQAQPVLTPLQIRQLLACCDPTLALAIHLAFAGTLRKGELLALTWRDVDMETGTVAVNKTLSRVGCDAAQELGGRDILHIFPPTGTRRQTMLVLKSPKTASSVRTLHLPETATAYLRQYQQTQAVMASPDVPDSLHMIFAYPDGRPFQESTLTNYFERALAKAELPKVTFHSLRHSSISYKLVLSGGDIKAVQGDSGHAQADMITEIYGHTFEENRRNTARRFEEAFYQSHTE